LVQSIKTANKFFLDQTQRQVNTSLTLRNWVIGYYIVEYEQKGKDRAEYGGKLVDNKRIEILQTVSGEFTNIKSSSVETLLGKLSFSHFIELIKIDTLSKRLFYETETIVNNWSKLRGDRHGASHHRPPSVFSHRIGKRVLL
jgi:hypothetical protein